MKVGDLVKCRATQNVGIIIAIGDHGFEVLFPNGLEYHNGGFLEVLN